MSIESVLTDLGLSKNKGLIYLSSLEIGTGSVVDIAKKAGLPRTTVHEILQNLVILGLISFATKGRTRIYTAEPPQKLKSILKDKERKLEGILPELSSLLNTSGIKPKIKFYEGVEGIKSVFEDTLTVKEKLLCGILSMQDLYQIPGKNYMDDYVKRRVEAGIKLNVIRSEGKEVEETWPFSAKESRELHYATKDMIFPMTMYLYDNKVGIIGTQKENFGLIIESEDFYRTQKNLFETLWQVTRVAKKID
ncbi:MAG: helix-turn-helix domain-containing protein [Patescibacteria group bacterium]|jgi:sugar-specific transcriptional regulator TrmB